MNTLVGSFGLVVVAPLTAIAASILFTRQAKAAAAKPAEAASIEAQ